MHARDPVPDTNADEPRSRTRRSVLATAIGTSLVGLAGCSSASPNPPTDSSSSQPNVDHEDYQGDAFTGTLTADVASAQAVTVATGLYEGTIEYDRSCKSVGGGLTGCDAGIETSELGTVNFYYEHDMKRKPCLAPEQRVILEVGKEHATVQRKVDDED